MSKGAKRTLIAKIHIAKKDLALDDATYRDVLERVTGKTSCKEMDLKELKKVMMELKRLGFVPTPTAITQNQTPQNPPQTTPKWGKKPDGADDKKALIGKIEAMLADLNLNWKYADGMAKRMFGVDKVQWLNQKNLYKLTQALAVHQQKQAKKPKP